MTKTVGTTLTASIANHGGNRGWTRKSTISKLLSLQEAPLYLNEQQTSEWN
jgi:hypothetical protein